MPIAKRLALACPLESAPKTTIHCNNVVLLSMSWFLFVRHYYGRPVQFLLLRSLICLNSAGTLVWVQIYNNFYVVVQRDLQTCTLSATLLWTLVGWHIYTSVVEAPYIFALQQINDNVVGIVGYVASWSHARMMKHRAKQTCSQLLVLNAFKSLRTHGIPHITVHTAIRCVLHRHSSQDIHRCD